MERVNTFRGKKKFNFRYLYRECKEILNTYRDVKMDKCNRMNSLNAFIQLLSMNLCRCVYQNKEEENKLVHLEIVKLLLHGDTIISAIKNCSVNSDIIIEWIIGKSTFIKE